MKSEYRKLPFLFTLIAILGVQKVSEAQSVSVNTTGNAPDPSSMLHVEATDKGLIVPRVQLNDSTNAAPVTSPAEGLIIYNETGSEPKGLYYWDSGLSSWVMVGKGAPDTYWTRDATNGHLYPNTISDNVGIGDATPEGKLDVHGRAYIAGDGDVMNDNAPELDLTIDDDEVGSNTGLDVPGNDTLTFFAGGSEQARIFPDGVMSVNSASPPSGETFYSEADPTSNDNAISGVVQGDGNAVFGINLAGAGDGVLGFANNASAYGVSAGNAANNGTAGFFRANNQGLFAYADSVPGGIGVMASGNGLAPVGPMDGAGISGAAKDIGVYGKADSIGGVGVVGVGNGKDGWETPPNGAGAIGAGIDVGLYGTADSVPGGVGVIGMGNNTTGIPSAPNGAGVLGNGTQVGLYGTARNATDGVGVRGLGNDVMTYTPRANGAGVSGHGTETGVYGRAESGANGTWGGYFANDNTHAYVGGTDAGGTGHKIQGPGVVATVVENEEGEEKAMFATETPEVLFEDHGQGRLKNGEAKVQLDPTFARNIEVDEEHPLRVFVQLEGDCKGVYVTDKSEDGFKVKELDGGRSDAPFTYKVVANRKDARIEFENGKVFRSKFEDVRFPDAMQPRESRKQRELNEQERVRKEDEERDVKRKKLEVPELEDDEE